MNLKMGIRFCKRRTSGATLLAHWLLYSKFRFQHYHHLFSYNKFFSTLYRSVEKMTLDFIHLYFYSENPTKHTDRGSKGYGNLDLTLYMYVNSEVSHNWALPFTRKNLETTNLNLHIKRIIVQLYCKLKHCSFRN